MDEIHTQDVAPSDFEIRATALHAALDFAKRSTGATSASVVEIAGEFYAFLSGAPTTA